MFCICTHFLFHKTYKTNVYLNQDTSPGSLFHNIFGCIRLICQGNIGNKLSQLNTLTLSDFLSPHLSVLPCSPCFRRSMFFNVGVVTDQVITIQSGPSYPKAVCFRSVGVKNRSKPKVISTPYVN